MKTSVIQFMGTHTASESFIFDTMSAISYTVHVHEMFWLNAHTSCVMFTFGVLCYKQIHELRVINNRKTSYYYYVKIAYWLLVDINFVNKTRGWITFNKSVAFHHSNWKAER